MAALEKHSVAVDLTGCQQLKLATRAAHEALHQTPLLKSFEVNRLDLHGYVQIMREFHQFYAGLDPLIERALPRLAGLGVPFSYAPRAPMFLRDIEALADPVPVPASRTDDGQCIGELASASMLAGALYVVEGSILGGSGLDRCAQQVLGQDDASGRTYWQWCRANASARWQLTRSLVDGVWLAEGQGNVMIDTANRVFASLLDRFDRAGTNVATSTGPVQ